MMMINMARVQSVDSSDQGAMHACHKRRITQVSSNLFAGAKRGQGMPGHQHFVHLPARTRATEQGPHRS